MVPDWLPATIEHFSDGWRSVTVDRPLEYLSQDFDALLIQGHLIAGPLTQFADPLNVDPPWHGPSVADVLAICGTFLGGFDAIVLSRFQAFTFVLTFLTRKLCCDDSLDYGA